MHNRHFHILPLILIIGIASFFGLASSPWISVFAKESIENLTSPSEIQIFRRDYIKNFKRIRMNSTPGDARFLRILIQSAQSKRGIEVGTATGYGAIVMGIGFERTQGELITIDVDPEMVSVARKHIKNMGLEKTVKVVEGDALEVIPKLEGEFDFIFIDAVKEDYLKYFKAVSPLLKPGAVIVADNVIRFEKRMRDFLDFMKNDPNYDMQIIRCSEEKSDGMAVIYKIK